MERGEVAVEPRYPAPAAGNVLPEDEPAGDHAEHSNSALRQTLEFLIMLLMGILFARTFAAEAYIVPTGSMAPTLLGIHRDYLCPNCHFRFALGIDEDGHAGRPVCPNCGQTDWDGAPAVESCGDRLLVQKYLFDLRPPRRWEAAVFQNPADPSQAYVKRVVGLPGESVQVRGGDVYIDGRIARKSLAEQRALRIPVFDNTFAPGDSARYPRWTYRHSGPGDAVGGWEPHGAGFHREPPFGPAAHDRIDWLDYQHWEPDRGAYGPVRDFNAYNGVELVGENRVRDLMIEAELALGAGTEALVLRLDSGADRFLVTIPTAGLDPIEVRRNGRKVRVLELPARYELHGCEPPRSRRLEASIADHRLLVAVDGVPIFEPYDFDDEADGPGSSSSPLGIGLRGPGRAEVAALRVFRDIYYTDSLISIPSHPFGVEEPYRLGPGEFFVLGDNSPVSNDSRFWPGSPVVRRESFVGKPFLVHLPSQAVPFRVFGRVPYWIPDPREIRYIR